MPVLRLPYRSYVQLPRRCFVERLSKEDRIVLGKALLKSDLAKDFGFKSYTINEDIKIQGQVSIISSSDRFLKHGTVSEALQLAKAEGLDAVQVSEEPPVVRICEVASLVLRAPSMSSHSNATFVMINFNITEHDLANKIKSISRHLDKNEACDVKFNFRGKDPEAARIKADTLAAEVSTALKAKYPGRVNIAHALETFAVVLRTRLPKVKAEKIPSTELEQESPTSKSWNVKGRIAKVQPRNIESEMQALENRFKARVEEAKPRDSGFNELDLSDDEFGDEFEEFKEFQDDDSKEKSDIDFEFSEDLEENANDPNTVLKRKEHELKRMLGSKLAYKIMKGKVKI